MFHTKSAAWQNIPGHRLLHFPVWKVPLSLPDRVSWTRAIMFMVPALLRLGSNSWALQRGRWKKDPSTGQKEALGCHGCHWSGPCTSKGAVLAKLQAPSLGGMLAIVGHGLQVRSRGTRPCQGLTLLLDKGKNLLRKWNI